MAKNIFIAIVLLVALGSEAQSEIKMNDGPVRQLEQLAENVSLDDTQKSELKNSINAHREAAKEWEAEAMSIEKEIFGEFLNHPFDEKEYKSLVSSKLEQERQKTESIAGLMTRFLTNLSNSQHKTVKNILLASTPPPKMEEPNGPVAQLQQLAEGINISETQKSDLEAAISKHKKMAQEWEEQNESISNEINGEFLKYPFNDKKFRELTGKKIKNLEKEENSIAGLMTGFLKSLNISQHKDLKKLLLASK